LILIIELLTDGPDASPLGMKVAVTFAGKPVTLSATVTGEMTSSPTPWTVTIAVLDSIALIAREDGDTEIPKSAVRGSTFR
jgi:hypothetical protein